MLYREGDSRAFWRLAVTSGSEKNYLIQERSISERGAGIGFESRREEVKAIANLLAQHKGWPVISAQGNELLHAPACGQFEGGFELSFVLAAIKTDPKRTQYFSKLGTYDSYDRKERFAMPKVDDETQTHVHKHHRREMLDLQPLVTIMHVKRRRDSPLIRSAYSKAMVAMIGHFGHSERSTETYGEER